jgi:crotonobetainyl-CoA:carnitine CoA-transferase CaiB-like acyl-CoA transferase
VAALETKYKKRLFQILGMEEFLENENEMTTTGVSADKERGAKEAMKHIIAGKTLKEWHEILDRADCLYSPVKTVLEALCDEQAIHREMIVDGYHPLCGPYKHLGSALKFSETPVDLQRIPAPALGEHTVPILNDMGLKTHSIEKLRKNGVVSFPSERGAK